MYMYVRGKEKGGVRSKGPGAYEFNGECGLSTPCQVKTADSAHKSCVTRPFSKTGVVCEGSQLHFNSFSMYGINTSNTSPF